MAKDKILYNGPQSKEANFFISQIDVRLDRPWNPAEEVSVMRAFAVTLRECCGKEKRDVK